MNNIHKISRKKNTAALLMISALLLTCIFLPVSYAENPETIISLKASVLNDTVALRFTSSTIEKIDYNIFTLAAPPPTGNRFP